MARFEALTGLLKDCADPYGNTGGEWCNNMISPEAVRCRSGRIGRPNELRGESDPEMLARIQELAAEVQPLVSGLSGSVEPFFVAARTDWKRRPLDAQAVRRMFGTTLFPEAIIETMPLQQWWAQMRRQEPDFAGHWAPLIAWLSSDRFRLAKYVTLRTDRGSGDYKGGCVLPKMWLGRLDDGSVGGVLSVDVWA